MDTKQPMACPLCGADLSPASNADFHCHPPADCILSGFEVSRTEVPKWNRRAVLAAATASTREAATVSDEREASWDRQFHEAAMTYRMATMAHAPDAYEKLLTLARAASTQATAADELVGEVVLFGGDLKAVLWRNGKMPAPGTKLYATPPQDGAQIRDALKGAAVIADAAGAEIRSLRTQNEMLRQELRNIANADTVEWDDPTEFEAWAKSRARHALSQQEG
ncbi:hypothetical protein [Paraburkholderia sp. 32]|uniref:hypothetical protein n=1 Tax=Paraburkholderia sp. 32 TaxID=2991057 RepID=UPI003D24F1AC